MGTIFHSFSSCYWKCCNDQEYAFLPGLWKEETTILMISNSKIKSEQSQALSLPAQTITQKSVEFLQRIMYIVTNINIKYTYHPQCRTKKEFNLNQIKHCIHSLPHSVE